MHEPDELPADAQAEADRFLEYMDLVEGGATELPPHLVGCPDLQAFREYMADLEELERPNAEVRSAAARVVEMGRQARQVQGGDDSTPPAEQGKVRDIPGAVNLSAPGKTGENRKIIGQAVGPSADDAAVKTGPMDGHDRPLVVYVHDHLGQLKVASSDGVGYDLIDGPLLLGLADLDSPADRRRLVEQRDRQKHPAFRMVRPWDRDGPPAPGDFPGWPRDRLRAELAARGVPDADRLAVEVVPLRLADDPRRALALDFLLLAGPAAGTFAATHAAAAAHRAARPALVAASGEAAAVAADVRATAGLAVATQTVLELSAAWVRWCADRGWCPAETIVGLDGAAGFAWAADRAADAPFSAADVTNLHAAMGQPAPPLVSVAMILAGLAERWAAIGRAN